MDEEDFPEDEDWDDWYDPFPMHVYAKVNYGRNRISRQSVRMGGAINAISNNSINMLSPRMQ